MQPQRKNKVCWNVTLNSSRTTTVENTRILFIYLLVCLLRFNATHTLPVTSIALHVSSSSSPARHQLVQNVLYSSWSSKQSGADGTTSSSTTAEANHCAVARHKHPPQVPSHEFDCFFCPIRLVHAKQHMAAKHLTTFVFVCMSLREREREKLVLKQRCNIFL